MSANSTLKEEYEYFETNDVVDLIRMYTEDSTVRGAFNLRYNQLAIPHMRAEKTGEEMGNLMSHVFTTYWSKFLRDMYDWFNLFDHCLYVVETEEIPVMKDELRMEKYGKLTENEDKIRVRVPIALPYSAEIEYAAMRKKKHKVDVVALTGEGVIDRKIKVVMQAPPNWLTRKHTSEVALLLRDWRELNEEKALHRQVSFSLACPPVFLQRTAPSDLQQMTELNALHAESRSLRRDKDGYFTKAEQIGSSVDSIHLEGKSTNDMLHRKLYQKKTLIDRQDNFIPIPPQFVVTNAVDKPNYIGDILKRVESFKEAVALMTMVPFHLIKPTYGSHGAKATEDTGMLKEHVQILAQSLARSLKEVWCVVYPDEEAAKLMIHLPVSSTTDLVSILQMFENGVVDENLAREEALHTFHIDPRRLGDKVPNMTQIAKEKRMKNEKAVRPL
jgi:hypothetical protein